MDSNYICIHGHFYQPPRENPWLEEVELEDSAYPFHDWNARITFDCYAPNTASRILDTQKRIVDIVNNYSKISFNFGPTLLSWLERQAPDEYKAILEADKESQKRFGGHGAALAQAFNHIIMPLANDRDRRTQVQWGIKDFEHRFGRYPEGMWLPETAANVATLETLAEHCINFTILAPRQAKAVRKIGENDWREVNESTIDTSRAYLCRLPSGKTIHLFFYNGAIAHEVSYGGLLHSGENLAKCLLGAFKKEDRPQLTSIATDGETFGHHHRYGDMALAYCLNYIESNNLANITIYSQFLEKHPPQYEIAIHENSSWSCVHGVERWRSHCGCHSGRGAEWTQKWRQPLREGMDWLRDTLTPVYEEQMRRFVAEPWQTRDEYVAVLLDRTPAKVKNFLSAQAGRSLNEEETTTMLKLLEMQRHAMLMFTSCGWFFDEISGIEGTQVMKYAARSMQLARETGGVELENDYKAILENAPSNKPRIKNGARAYEIYVQPAAIDLHRVGAHYAVSSLFEEYQASRRIYCYSALNETFERFEAGTQSLVIGRVRLHSLVTEEEHFVDFAVLHLGGHDLYGGVAARMDEDAFVAMSMQARESFSRSDISSVIRLMNQYFGTHNYSLWYLFKDEQRRIVTQILQTKMREIAVSFRHIYENNYPLMQAMKEMRMPLPRELSTPAEFVITGDFVEELEKDDLDIGRLQSLADEIKKWSFHQGKTTLSFVASQKINSLMKNFYEMPEELPRLEKMEAVVRILQGTVPEINVWQAQNMCFSLRKQHYAKMKDAANKGFRDARKWIAEFNKIAEYLEVKV
jgi:alpha-amylase/alpha-mannosidase (GH57 family)